VAREPSRSRAGIHRRCPQPGRTGVGSARWRTNFSAVGGTTITEVVFWGGYVTPPGQEGHTHGFTIRFYTDNGAPPARGSTNRTFSTRPKRCTRRWRSRPVHLSLESESALPARHCRDLLGERGGDSGPWRQVPMSRNGAGARRSRLIPPAPSSGSQPELQPVTGVDMGFVLKRRNGPGRGHVRAKRRLLVTTATTVRRAAAGGLSR